jgi:hypothetical protein
MQRLRLRARGLVFDTRRPGRPRGSRSYCCMGSRRPPPAGSGWRRRWPRSGTGCWRPTSEATRRAPGRRRCVPEAAIPESGAISGSAVAPAPRRVDEPVAEAAATNDRLVATRRLRLTDPAVAAGAVGPGPQPGDNRSGAAQQTTALAQATARLLTATALLPVRVTGPGASWRGPPAWRPARPSARVPGGFGLVAAEGDRRNLGHGRRWGRRVCAGRKAGRAVRADRSVGQAVAATAGGQAHQRAGRGQAG